MTTQDKNVEVTPPDRSGRPVFTNNQMAMEKGMGQPLTEQECNLLQQIDNSWRLNYPCTLEMVCAAKPLIERGLVKQVRSAPEGYADLRITDDAKWAALAAGHPVQGK